MIELEQQFSGKSQTIYSFYCNEDITDILINGCQSLFVERLGTLEAQANPFDKTSDLCDLIERLLVPIGKRIDASQPYLDGRLSDGGRFHIILPPIAPDGPYISIRKQKRPGALTVADFAPPAAQRLLEESIISRENLLVVGATGSGKTTLIGRLIDLVPDKERVTIIEDTREIQSIHPHTVRLEGRQASTEGVGEVTLRTLLKNALRMRPDRLVLGECRGEEAFDLLQALNTGHGGSLGTLHANSPLDALSRLESLVLLTGYDLSPRTVRSWIASSINLVIHLDKVGSKRMIREIIRLSGLEGEIYRHLPLYSIHQDDRRREWGAITRLAGLSYP